MYFIGVDLGTSAVKLLLMSEDGTVEKIVSKEYALCFPHPGWSEQNPADWWSQSIAGLKELTAGCDKSQIAGISFGGQMHGLVILDEKDEVIRPAILWNDGRTMEETDYLNNVIGKEKLSKLTGNIAFTGFTAPKILWVKNHEPENFARIHKLMLPKDYLAYRLTGVNSTDYSDASGMLLLDVEHKCWSKEMMEICSVKEEWMPKLFESYEKTGTLLPEVAKELGFPENCSRNRMRRRRQVQPVTRHKRNDFYHQWQLWGRSVQCAAFICTCRRQLSSDGLHALCGKLQ